VCKAACAPAVVPFLSPPRHLQHTSSTHLAPNLLRATVSCDVMSEENIDKHVLEKYEIQQKLGKGVCHVCGCHVWAEHDRSCMRVQAYGVVWRAVDKKTKETVALKKIFDAFQNATDAQV
jgi:hypothetical protein